MPGIVPRVEETKNRHEILIEEPRIKTKTPSSGYMQ